MERAKSHTNDYCFCSIDVSGYKSKNKNVIFYLKLTSGVRPIGRTLGLPNLCHLRLLMTFFQCSPKKLKPQRFRQAKLNEM